MVQRFMASLAIALLTCTVSCADSSYRDKGKEMKEGGRPVGQEAKKGGKSVAENAKPTGKITGRAVETAPRMGGKAIKRVGDNTRAALDGR
jgi:hypothetical protein